MVAALILIADLIADGDVAGSGSTLRWSFGITTLAFGNFFASSLSSSRKERDLLREVPFKLASAHYRNTPGVDKSLITSARCGWALLVRDPVGDGFVD